MADAKMLSEKYLNDVDVQAKWMLCRLCDLEERFFDKGETISLDEVSEIKIEVPLNSYEKIMRHLNTWECYGVRQTHLNLIL